MSRAQFANKVAYVLGLLAAFVLCGRQSLKAFESLEGVSLAQYFTFGLSFVLGTSLALSSLRSAKTRGTRRKALEQVHMQGIWVAGSAILITVVFLTGEYRWNASDTRIVYVALLGFALTFLVSRMAGLSLSHPAIKALTAIALKSAPQFMLVFKIRAEGGGGYDSIAIWAGHTSIIARLYSQWVLAQEEGWDADKRWLFVADTANEATWVLVTYYWLRG